LVTAAMMDGKVDAHEQAMLQNACTALGLPPDELQRQLAAAQQRMQAQQRS
jgi:tellurite resistance protein